MWKFQDNSTIQILCKINYGHFEPTKAAILTILETLKIDFGTFQPYKMAKIHQNQNSEPPKCQKWQFLDF